MKFWNVWIWPLWQIKFGLYIVAEIGLIWWPIFEDHFAFGHCENNITYCVF